MQPAASTSTGFDRDDNGETIVRNVLTPHVQILNNVMKDSWKYYWGLDEDERYKWDSRTRANIMSRNILKEIERKFYKVPGISIIDVNGFYVLNFHNRVTVRFKFLDKKGRAGNVQTKQQIAYDNQLELPNLPPKAIRAIVGYQTNYDETGIKDILVSRFIGRKRLWQYSILDTNVSAIQPTLPIEDHEIVNQPTKRRVKPKNLESKDESQGTGNQNSSELVQPEDVKQTNKSKDAISKKPSRRVKPKKLEQPGENNGEAS